MYVSDREKAIYIHIPKTGGTALLRYLFRRSAFSRVGNRHDGLWALDTPEKYTNYFAFAFVRNPYTRLVSKYRFHLTKHPEKQAIEKKYRTLYDFLCDPKIARLPHCQCDYIENEVIKPKIYYYEKFNAGVKDICKELGMLTNQIHKNKSTHFHGNYDYTKWLDNRSIARINEICKKDFERFGYERIPI